MVEDKSTAQLKALYDRYMYIYKNDPSTDNQLEAAEKAANIKSELNSRGVNARGE